MVGSGGAPPYPGLVGRVRCVYSGRPVDKQERGGKRKKGGRREEGGGRRERKREGRREKRIGRREEGEGKRERERERVEREESKEKLRTMSTGLPPPATTVPQMHCTPFISNINPLPTHTFATVVIHSLL